MTPEDTAGTNFELIMTVEGIVEATGWWVNVLLVYPTLLNLLYQILV